MGPVRRPRVRVQRPHPDVRLGLPARSRWSRAPAATASTCSGRRAADLLRRGRHPRASSPGRASSRTSRPPTTRRRRPSTTGSQVIERQTWLTGRRVTAYAGAGPARHRRPPAARVLPPPPAGLRDRRPVTAREPGSMRRLTFPPRTPEILLASWFVGISVMRVSVISAAAPVVRREALPAPRRSRWLHAGDPWSEYRRGDPRRRPRRHPCSRCRPAPRCPRRSRSWR